jgi:cell division protein ZapA
MTEETTEIKINVHVCGRKYPLSINPRKEEYIRKAAMMINEQVDQLKGTFRAKDDQDYLSITALQYAAGLLEMQDGSLEGTWPELADKLRALSEEMSTLIKK